MKSMILAFVLAVAGVVGLGCYMGWFRFSSASDGNKASITLSMDKGKIEEDKDKAVNKLHDVEQRAKDKTTAVPQRAQD